MDNWKRLKKEFKGTLVSPFFWLCVIAMGALFNLLTYAGEIYIMKQKSVHQQNVEEFMELAGQHIPARPLELTPELRILRARLVLEEALELVESLGVGVFVNEGIHMNELVFDMVHFTTKKDMSQDSGERSMDMQNMIKEACDVSVVTIGTLSSAGIPDTPFLNMVDDNNLMKFGGDGYRDDHGKWIKPSDHPKPEIGRLLDALDKLKNGGTL